MAVLGGSASWGQGEKRSEGKGDSKYLLLQEKSQPPGHENRVFR